MLAERRGLQAQDENICTGRDQVVTSETGTLSDDQTGETIDCTQGGCNGLDTGHNGYGDNLDCGKHIQAPEGSVVALTISYIALEQANACPSPGCDYVAVYDGADQYGPELGKFSGTELPHPVRSTGRDMYVRFVTDAVRPIPPVVVSLTHADLRAAPQGNYGLAGESGFDAVSDDPGFYAYARPPPLARLSQRSTVLLGTGTGTSWTRSKPAAGSAAATASALSRPCLLRPTAPSTTTTARTSATASTASR